MTYLIVECDLPEFDAITRPKVGDIVKWTRVNKKWLMERVEDKKIIFGMANKPTTCITGQLGDKTYSIKLKEVANECSVITRSAAS